MAISFRNRLVRIPVLLAIFVTLVSVMTALPENVPGVVKVVVLGLFVVIMAVMEFHFCLGCNW